MLGLYGLKSWFGGLLAPVLNLAARLRLSPDVFTLLGVAGGVLAGFGVSTLEAWIVLVGGVVRLAGANLDGALARKRGRPTRGGAFKNEVGDRIADFATMLAFAAIPAVAAEPALQVLCLTASAAAVLPSAASWFGLRRGQARINGGPLGKTERTFLAVLLVAAIQLGAESATVISIGMSVVIVGSVLTALLRLRQIRA